MEAVSNTNNILKFIFFPMHRKLVKMMEPAVARGCGPWFFFTKDMLGETALRDSACV